MHPPSARRARRRIGELSLWTALYVALVTLPLFALMPQATGGGAGFWWDFGIALGYAGLAMMGVQFSLTARFKRATAPFGIDIVYAFHRYLAIGALLLLLGHYLVLRLDAPAALGSADPRRAEGYMTAGRLALGLFALVVATSLLRRVIALPYEAWRITHVLLSTAAFALAGWHLLGAGYYLDQPWKQALWIAFGAFWLGLVLKVRLLRPWRLLRHPWRVVSVKPDRGQVCTLSLVPERGSIPAFKPGQFAWVSLARSPWSMQEHPFSIASSAERAQQIDLSIKALGDFTATIKDVQPGQRVWVDTPYGSFGIDERPDAERYVFIAGGVGIAPIISMLRTLADRGDRRPLILFYGNRVWDRVALREELDALAQRLTLKIVHVLLEPPPGWTGETGLITAEILSRHLQTGSVQAAHTEYFLCGPNPMTHSVEKVLAGLGVPDHRIHCEIFDWV